jgi:2-deoxy-D-gluconate 3-dehydrogenase
MKDLFDLKGRVAIVTGGNGGIGLGIARGLASAGASLAIAARNEAKTAGVVKGLQNGFGVKVIGVKVDVREEKQIKGMVQKVLDTFGRIDILFNNAGTNIRKLPQEYTVAEWDEVLDINLRSAFLCSKAVYPAMKAAGGGKIINTGSMTSIFSAPKLTLYSSSKGGIVQLARSLANAWAKDNIQVNAILPGFINTDLTRQARKDMSELEERVNMRTPAGRWGEPDDLAGTAVFLASRASDFVTGVALPVDGGFSVAML